MRGAVSSAPGKPQSTILAILHADVYESAFRPVYLHESKGTHSLVEPSFRPTGYCSSALTGFDEREKERKKERKKEKGRKTVRTRPSGTFPGYWHMQSHLGEKVGIRESGVSGICWSHPRAKSTAASWMPWYGKSHTSTTPIIWKLPLLTRDAMALAWNFFL
ncbi:hypothetical protein BDP55DRAFT_628020 [Colletotrichum godetiae]|uniref:Uncharacterized protein n=1 Tax=Colletotrichum godetiae TaxID=1209918 RepID=A0AAJ0AWW3_9PEZI|nr:uncharacterized protein BDP55DRAFT_628020 [Colletotrichum godetiae]KAK1690335.1 hypothetical protein BDP55DRAFT_628020 [Colletotrichum godetiae]